ncbi:hypothetical protein niasHT_028576 [Heterodera trifolii]|uniref:Uncharacterized protein n=1 Tax=Heterodera trifolii TaxID=157864 RepID=A0ABD2JP01_9BILA
MALRWTEKFCDTLRHGFYARRRTNAKGSFVGRKQKGLKKVQQRQERRALKEEKESEEITVIYERMNKRGGEEERNESDEGEVNTEEIGERGKLGK